VRCKLFAEHAQDRVLECASALISITSSAGSIWLGVSLALALGGWGCKLTAGDVEACWIGPEGSIIGAFLNALSDCPFLIRLQTMRKTSKLVGLVPRVAL
jgi:hypothetical protein